MKSLIIWSPLTIRCSVCVCFERVCGTACVCYLCSGSPVCWQPPRIIVSFFFKKNLHIQWDFAVAGFCWLSEQDVLSGLLGGPWLFLTVLWASLYGKLCIWLSRIYCKASFTKIRINQIVWKAVRRGNTKRKRSCLALLRNNHCLSSCFWVKTASTFKWVWQTKCAYGISMPVEDKHDKCVLWLDHQHSMLARKSARQPLVLCWLFYIACMYQRSPCSLFWLQACRIFTSQYSQGQGGVPRPLPGISGSPCCKTS